MLTKYLISKKDKERSPKKAVYGEKGKSQGTAAILTDHT